MTGDGIAKSLPLVLALTVLLMLALPAEVGGSAEHGGGRPALMALGLLPRSTPSEGSEESTTLVTPENQPLSVAAPYLNPTVIDSGQRLALKVNITGGYKPYNIKWIGLPGGGCYSHNATSFGCDVGAPSGMPTTFEVSVQVVDTMGTLVTSNTTAVTVNPTPSVAIEISPVSGGIPPFTLTFTAQPTFGTPPFSYFWIFGDGANATGTTVQHTFAILGTFVVTVWGNDSLGSNVSGFAKVHSVTAPSVALSLLPHATINEGDSVSFVVSPSGGLGPFTYVWTGLPSFCPPVTAQNTSEVTCSGAASGSYTVTVELTDSLLHTATSSVTLTVSTPPTIWEYVAIGAVVLAVALAIVVVVQVIHYRRERRPPSALRPASVGPSN